MSVESSALVMDSLLEKLKLDDPWVPPRSWDSIASQPGVSSQPCFHSPLYATSIVSEPSLVRLAMNALQGVESALISIDKLSAVLRRSSADRTAHRIPSLWTRCSSNVVVGNLLTSIGQSGFMIFILRRFVNYFTNPDFIGARELEENAKGGSCEVGKISPHFSLISQAFAISVGKVVDGYVSALNTLSASVSLRHFLKTNNGGCLTSIGDSEITLLEVYLHTMELRTQIEALGNLCNVDHLTIGFPISSLKDLRAKADSEFAVFPRSDTADPAHSALLKFLFIQSYEPYSDFITSWIYDGALSDPYHEFVVECVSNLSTHASGETGIPSILPLPTIRVQDGAAVPCFLEECLVPLCRTGQQLQVIMELLKGTNNVGTCDTHEGILPTLVGLSSECPWFGFPLSFDKGTIETMTLVRASYYQKMLEKIGNISTKFDFSSRQRVGVGVYLCHVPRCTCLSNNINPVKTHDFNNYLKSLPSHDVQVELMDDCFGLTFIWFLLCMKVAIEKASVTVRSVSSRLANNVDHQISFIEDESLIPPRTVRRDKNVPDTIMDSEVASIVHEYPYAEDLLESSECSSPGRSEEADDAEQMIFTSCSAEPSYLSALDFSLSLSAEISCSVKDFPSKLSWKSGYTAYHSHKQTCLTSTEQTLSQPRESQVSSSEDDLYLLCGQHGKHDTWSHSPDCGLELSRDYGLSNTGLDVSGNAFEVSVGNTDQHPYLTCASSKTFNLQFCDRKYNSTFFSMNPTLNRGSIYNLAMLEERGRTTFMDSHFDFTSVEDPLSTYAVRLAGDQGPTLRTEISVITETPAARVDTSNHIGVQDCNDVIMENDAELCNNGSSLHNKDSNEGYLLVQNTSGGSAWESLLGRSDNSVNRSARDHRALLVSGADMPLDFVIKKCVVDEILLQISLPILEANSCLVSNNFGSRYLEYKYLSKLTINLLIEGFKLQEHLQSLRCYYFMELADWANLFIISLWHRKWHVSELDKRIPEIQGVLELSVRRSSCEGDPNKDRLYVYQKGDEIKHSVSAMGTAFISVDVSMAKGIHSFDFLGLGYHIDWPVSIILTSAALEIYSEIFNFLIQVKLAVFSLSDSWASLKMHKVNHFVSALQQYVQSQLSQVSWYRFLDALKYKLVPCFPTFSFIPPIWKAKLRPDIEAFIWSLVHEKINNIFVTNEETIRPSAMMLLAALYVQRSQWES
ncbi:hypothetical protein OROMI_016367 [Orobanche minor]